METKEQNEVEMPAQASACKLGIEQLTDRRSWCVTHNQLLHFCDPDPRSDAGTMRLARETVKDFWRSLPEDYRKLWLLEGPCEALIESMFAALQARAFPSEADKNGLSLFRQLASGKNALREMDVFPCNETAHPMDCECFWEQCEAWAKADERLTK